MLLVENTHCDNCGSPPGIVKRQDDDIYLGYFENRYSEQWVVQIDRRAKTGVLRGGDVGWECSYAMQDDRLDPNLILSRGSRLARQLLARGDWRQVASDCHSRDGRSAGPRRHRRIDGV